MLEREMIPIAGRDDLVIQVTDDGSRTLMDHNQGVAFHSAAGARTETQHVYLDNSGVSDRIRQGLETRVLEIGLGTALGMLMTVDLAITAECGLQYQAWESDLLDADILESLNLGQSLQQAWLVDSFISWRRGENDNGSKIAIAINVVKPGKAPTNIPENSPTMIIRIVSRRNAINAPSAKCSIIALVLRLRQRSFQPYRKSPHRRIQSGSTPAATRPAHGLRQGKAQSG